MSSFTGYPTSASPSPGRKSRVVSSSNERGIRQHATDFSQTSIIHEGDISLSGRSTPRGPNIGKDLPRIPSTSTGLWGTEPQTISSEMMASPVTSPTPTRSLFPASQPLKRTVTTEAQKIAARYRRRYGSLKALRSEVVCPPRLEVSSYLISGPFSFPHGCRG